MTKYFRVPIGKPVLNSIAYVLDDEKMPVPLGETGQLYVSSKNLCDGYVGKNNNNFGLNKVCIQTFFSSRCIVQNLEPNLLFYLTFMYYGIFHPYR